MYWPSRQAKSEVHGPLRVTYLDEEAFAFYTVRRFEVKPVDDSNHYCQVGLHHLVQHNKQHHKNILLNRFHLNGHTLGFHPQKQKLEPPCTA